MPLFAIALIYLLPGVSLSRIFRGNLRNNIFFTIFLSLVMTPALYTLSSSIGQNNPLFFFLLNMAVFTILYSFGRVSGITVDTGKIFPNTGIPGWLIFLLLIFFAMNIIPRIGLVQGSYPIGDDMRRLGKTVSVAVSDNFPLFYHFPASRMTIYYFVSVGPGLLVKFSQNVITANLAWFLHLSLWYLAMLYLIAICAVTLFEGTLSRLLFTGGLTLFSGYEFYVALIKKVNPLNLVGSWTDLEWWTDWFKSVFNIHFQISSPYTQFFWVPQHMFAGILTLLIFMILRSEESKKPVVQALLGSIFFAIFGYSAFVFLTTTAAYSLLTINRLRSGEETLKKTFIKNLIVISTFLVLSLDLMALYLGSEKTSWFEARLNVFWFLPNTDLLAKLVNLILTVPLILFVELGGLFVALIYATHRLLKIEKEKDLIFWHIAVFLPFMIMFFLRASDDNNISLRSTIPSLIGLSIFAGKLAEGANSSYTNLRTSRIVKTSVIILLIFSLPTTSVMFIQRFTEQFSFGQQNWDAVYEKIDKTVPLNSIVLTDTANWSNISTLAHRFTFKPSREFDFTDHEYSAKSKIKPFSDFKSETIPEIIEFKNRIQRDVPHLKGFGFYLLTEKELKMELITESEKYNVYKL